MLLPAVETGCRCRCDVPGAACGSGTMVEFMYENFNGVAENAEMKVQKNNTV